MNAMALFGMSINCGIRRMKLLEFWWLNCLSSSRSVQSGIMTSLKGITSCRKTIKSCLKANYLKNLPDKKTD